MKAKDNEYTDYPMQGSQFISEEKISESTSIFGASEYMYSMQNCVEGWRDLQGNNNDSQVFIEQDLIPKKDKCYSKICSVEVIKYGTLNKIVPVINNEVQK